MSPSVKSYPCSQRMRLYCGLETIIKAPSFEPLYQRHRLIDFLPWPQPRHTTADSRDDNRARGRDNESIEITTTAEVTNNNRRHDSCPNSQIGLTARFWASQKPRAAIVFRMNRHRSSFGQYLTIASLRSNIQSCRTYQTVRGTAIMDLNRELAAVHKWLHARWDRGDLFGEERVQSS